MAAINYNKVDSGLWTGDSFRALSKMECSGQALWLYLLTCDSRHSSGIFRIGPGTISDDTGWVTERVTETLCETVEQGLIEYDEEARIVRLVKGLQKTPPDNGNHVKNYMRHIESLPNSPLKFKQLRELRDLCEGLGEPFAKPIHERFPEGLPEGYSNPPTTTPTTTKAKTTSTSTTKSKTTEHQTKKMEKSNSEDFEQFWEAYPNKTGKGYSLECWKKKTKGVSIDTILESVEAHKAGKWKGNEQYIPSPSTWINQQRWQDDPNGPKGKDTRGGDEYDLYDSD